MFPVAFALAATLAFNPFTPGHHALVGKVAAQPGGDPEPDPSWGESEEDTPEADAPEDATPEAEAPASPTDAAATEEAPTPEPAAVPAPVPTSLDVKPATLDDLQVPKNKGIGLLIAAGALGAGAWGVMGWRMTLIKECELDGIDANEPVDQEVVEREVGGLVGCLGARTKTMAAWLIEGSMNAVSWGLAGGGGDVKAHYDAASSVKFGKPRRKPVVFSAVGGTVLGLGVVGRVVVAVLRPRIRRNCVADASTYGDFFDCYTRGMQMHFFAQQFTASAIGAGVGMLTYGISYKVRRETLQEGYGAGAPQARVRLVPELGGVYNGMSLVGRF